MLVYQKYVELKIKEVKLEYVDILELKKIALNCIKEEENGSQVNQCLDLFISSCLKISDKELSEIIKEI